MRLKRNGLLIVVGFVALSVGLMLAGLLCVRRGGGGSKAVAAIVGPKGDESTEVIELRSRVRVLEAELAHKEQLLKKLSPQSDTDPSALPDQPTEDHSPIASVGDGELFTHLPCPTDEKGIPCGDSRHRSCNHKLGKCECGPGKYGKRCDISLTLPLRLTAGGTKASRAEPPSYADDRRAVVSALLTVIIGSEEPSANLVRSIKTLYPTVQCVFGAGANPCDASLPHQGATPGATPTDKPQDVAAIFNKAVAQLIAKGDIKPLVLFLSPNTISLHEHTNLELAVELLLTTDADVMGFLQLNPLDQKVKLAAAAPKSQWTLDVPCWQLSNSRWILRHFRAEFGYDRHERLAMYCDRVSDSFIVHLNSFRRPTTTKGGETNFKLFYPEMQRSVFLDFWWRIKRDNAAITNRSLTPPTDPIALRLAEVAPTRQVGFKMVGVCAECLLKAQPWLNTAMGEALSAPFSEENQVELLVGPSTEAAISSLNFGAPTSANSKANVDRSTETLMGSPASNYSPLTCVKSGGIYGHSNRGLYSPLCHRFHRQRDFKYLADLWTSADGKLPSQKPNPTEVAYAISLHHGNLFGALRMNVELLWETDGDIDFISFVDDHDHLLSRFDALKRKAEENGFEVKMNYPDKPWYCSFLKDKTDFQINARSVLDPQTRGKPPQIHNISIPYQGRLVYMNGFQNPWKSIRLDPGHDYMDRYLAQQGWVLHYTNASVSCLVPGHPACLPPCNDKKLLLDHNFCSSRLHERHSPASLSVTLRDPLLFSKEGVQERSAWNPHTLPFI